MATHSIGDSETKTISLEKAMWPKVQERMNALADTLPVRKMTFSAYVQLLLKKDLNCADGDLAGAASPVASAIGEVQHALADAHVAKKKARRGNASKRLRKNS